MRLFFTCKNFSAAANRFGAAEALVIRMDTIRKGSNMLYVKNLPARERWGRGLAGLGLVVFGIAVSGGAVFGVAAQWVTLAGWGLIGTGAIALLSGFVGFCPMCAMVGRKPLSGG
jgi:hypothetical protein